MNRRLIRKEKEFEWDKILYKNILEELRISKDKIWKITNYTILIYAGIFAMINITIDKKITMIFGQVIFFTIFLTGSISFKIITRLYVEMMLFKVALRRYNRKYKFIDYFSAIDKSVLKEDVVAIFLILFISYYTLLFYSALYFKFTLWQLIIIFALYLFYEIGLIRMRRKFLKEFFWLDIVVNILIIAGLICVFIISNLEIIKNLIEQFMRKI